MAYGRVPLFKLHNDEPFAIDERNHVIPLTLGESTLPRISISEIKKNSTNNISRGSTISDKGKRASKADLESKKDSLAPSRPILLEKRNLDKSLNKLSIDLAHSKNQLLNSTRKETKTSKNNRASRKSLNGYDSFSAHKRSKKLNQEKKESANMNINRIHTSSPLGSSASLRQLKLKSRFDDNNTTSDDDEDSEKAKLEPQILMRFYKCGEGYKPQLQKFIPKLGCPPVSRSAWIETVQSSVEIAGFSEIQDKVIIYVDSARFLPDNVSGTKLSGRIVNSQMKMMDGTKFETDILVDTPVYFPLYNKKIKVRRNMIRSDSFLFIDIYSFDRQTAEPMYIGCVVHNLALDKQTESKEEAKSTTGVKINTGSFQLYDI